MKLVVFCLLAASTAMLSSTTPQRYRSIWAEPEATIVRISEQFAAPSIVEAAQDCGSAPRDLLSGGMLYECNCSAVGFII
jgi:hypothetical protein